MKLGMVKTVFDMEEVLFAIGLLPFIVNICKKAIRLLRMNGAKVDQVEKWFTFETNEYELIYTSCLKRKGDDRSCAWV